ncbi:membrane protein [Lactococcus termiticola]|uniref:Membrane protein n=2 Tax=Lactococcus termiticola TaxID=2169526 RepID=A0A2R5HFC0_9LACT|nr:membrane protein [Lactococcus termiticola]
MDSDWKYEGASWMAPNSSSVPVYRVYNPKSGEHLYTRDANEASVLVASYHWSNEGTAFYSDAKQGKADYRLYNPAAGVGSHFTTSSSYERDQLIKQGWKYEGIAWYGTTDPVVTSYVPPKTPTSPKPYAKAPVYYSQWDPRWSNVRIGPAGYTVGQAGCVPTSIAMVLKGSYGMNLDPGTVAQRANNYIPGSEPFGMNGQDLIRTVNSYGHNVEVVGSQQRAIDLLKAGYPLIFFINVGTGHAVVAYGYNNGTTMVNDPWHRQFYPNGTGTVSGLWAIPSPLTEDWNAGRPVFAIK